MQITSMSNVQNQHKQCKLHQRRISEIDVEFGKMDSISTNNANYIYVENGFIQHKQCKLHQYRMFEISTNNANYIHVEVSEMDLIIKKSVTIYYCFESTSRHREDDNEGPIILHRVILWYDLPGKT